MGYGVTMLVTSPCTDIGNLYVGSQVFRRYEVRDEEGELTASTVTGTMELPDGNDVNLTVTPESTGVYLITFPPFAMRGWHDWVVSASGPVYQVDKGRLHVKP